MQTIKTKFQLGDKALVMGQTTARRVTKLKVYHSESYVDGSLEQHAYYELGYDGKWIHESLVYAEAELFPAGHELAGLPF